MTRWVVLLAVAAYVTLAGCVMGAGSSRGSRSLLPPGDAGVTSRVDVQRVADDERDGRTPLPIFAIGMQVQRTDWIDRYKQSIDEAADLGATAVKIVCDARQEDGASNRIYLDLRRTPTADQLGELFRHADARGLDVIFMPIVLLDEPKADEWRGTLTPQSWDNWFDSYREILAHFLWICEGNGVDVFVVGSELLSSERQQEQWARTIAFCRERFSGLLTYSSNWDHYHNVPFWDDLDLIGMNSYWRLGGGPKVTADEVAANWKPIRAGLETFVRAQGKPLLFLEVGWASLDNAASEPWDYTQPVPVNVELQATLWEGFWQAWHGTPWLGGMSVWEWPPGEGGPDDRGYTPRGKPAEDVLRTWFGRPHWAVTMSP